ncbi:cysteine--tRNA ligase, partial [Candidatus Parcubacteria bacterium]|nr:cysteine--tRNA ligase [Candidatus Parcubacteria bacterium]
LPLKIKKLISQREKARQNKQWPQADQIRQKIEKAGFKVEDTILGPKVIKKI